MNTQPINQAHAMPSETADLQAQEASPVELAREPLPPVEKVTAPAVEAIMPPPHAQLPKPPQTAGEVVPIHEAKVENLILLPAVLSDAEKHLAAHIGGAIDPILETNLVLNVSSNLERGTTNLVLSFEGDMVAANPAVLGEQVIAALHKLPAMQALIAEHHHTPTAEFHDGKLHIVVPHLTTAKYAHLIQALAAGVEQKKEIEQAVPVHTETADHQCSGAGCSHCNAQGADAPAKVDVVPPPQSVTPEMHPVAEVAAVAQASVAQAVGVPPATQVAGVNHHGVANDNVTERAVG